jgi:hypothetical protein
MLDTLKNAALAALLVFALVYATGIATRPVNTASSKAKTYPSTASEKYAGAAEGATAGKQFGSAGAKGSPTALPCSYDGNFDNDTPGCR